MGVILVSDCGEYPAIKGALGFDVVATDGSCIWLASRRRYTGFDDPLLSVPEFEHQVVAEANYSRTTRAGNRIHDYAISFADIDMSMAIEPYTGNAITRHYRARFRKRVRRLTRKRKIAKGGVMAIQLDFYCNKCQNWQPIGDFKATLDGEQRNVLKVACYKCGTLYSVIAGLHSGTTRYALMDAGSGNVFVFLSKPPSEEFLEMFAECNECDVEVVAMSTVAYWSGKTKPREAEQVTEVLDRLLEQCEAGEIDQHAAPALQKCKDMINDEQA